MKDLCQLFSQNDYSVNPYDDQEDDIVVCLSEDKQYDLLIDLGYAFPDM